ncbi:MAG: PQQ-binding-like beta-propeller repeat protein [Methyloceanibacter sp.]|nr:PQQ-binding-like beta-propeller repeat protein [Methyloceanibacter sp.]
MRLVVGLFVTLICCTAAADPKLLWEAKGLEQPESVVQDPATGAIYVSNIAGAIMQKDGNGFIAKLRPDGTVIERQWVKGLNAPTGLALHDRTLYVADVDELVEINIASGEIVKRYEAKGAIFLNDVAVADDGTVYASDTPMNTIWRLKDGNFEPWMANDALNGPNGLLVQGDKLVVASFGKLPSEGQKQELGGLFAIDVEKQSVSKLGESETIGNLDGLQALQPGVYLVTDWAAGGLYRVGAKGKAERLIKLGKGSADFIYFPDTKLALIPIMLNNALVAYALE